MKARVTAGFLAGIALVGLAFVGARRAVPDLYAQQSKPATQPATSSTEIKVQTNLVNVMFSVTDRKSHMVVNLDKDDVQVMEDNKPQAISFFSRETDLPLRIGKIGRASCRERV